MASRKRKSLNESRSASKLTPAEDAFLNPPLKLPSAKRVLPLDKIEDRPHGDSRPLNSAHVNELMDSIAAVGLIQPLAVDKLGQLLAGGHRRAALLQLREAQPDVFEEMFSDGNIPVRVFMFEAQDDLDLAIAIEAAENEKRRDYTPTEVKELADRLITAGYQQTRGKPKPGVKALQPALATIIGKSTRTVQRYLQNTSDKNQQLGQSSLNTTDVVIKSLITALKRFEALEVEDFEHLSDPEVVLRQVVRLRKKLDS